jgi:modulator of FtsH protease HflK
MYLDAMQQIYSNVTKVVIDSKQGSNLMYLPLDKLIQMTAAPSSATVETPASNAASSSAASSAPVDPRSRDSLRSRDREIR